MTQKKVLHLEDARTRFWIKSWKKPSKKTVKPESRERSKPSQFSKKRAPSKERSETTQNPANGPAPTETTTTRQS